MVDPLIIGGIVAGAGVAAAAGYAHLSGNSASATVDVDDDGTDEASIEFEGDAGEDPNPPLTDPEGMEDGSQEDPIPEAVEEKSGLTDITGIGPTRAENLGKAGFSNPEDIYFASDSNLTGVHGIGPTAVEQMRDDIGGVDEEGNESNDTGESDQESQSDASTDGEQNDTEQPEDQTDDTESSDSTQETDSGQSENESADE